MVLQRFCQAVVRRASREGESAEERRRKEIFVPIMVGLTIAILFYEVVFVSYTINRPFLASMLGMHGALVGCFTGAFVPLATRKLTTDFIGRVSAALCIMISLLDLSYASGRNSFRPWSFVVLVMDVHLALNVPRSYQRVALHTTAAWVLLTYVEDAFRLGLYDIDGFSDKSEDVRGDYCDCADPPCKRGLMGLFPVFMPCIVLYCDFFATRGFAEGLRSEQAKVSASVVTAERVAEGLAGFDLDAAEQALHKAGGELPDGLSRSFARLLRNLSRYRPYLPQSCFEEGADDAFHSTEVPADAATPLTQGRGASASWANGARRRSTESPQSPAESGASRASSDCGTAPVRYRHAQQTRRVTLLGRNSIGFLGAARDQPESVAAWVAEEVQRFADVVRQRNGVSDLLSGDHFTASFGAVKVQGSQCTSATRAATLLIAEGAAEMPLAELQASVAVCSGKALCGDFGSAAVQRFMVIGGVSAFFVVTERAAAAWRVPLLIDSVVHADAQQLWCCRLRKLAVFPKVSAKPVGLWEVLDERMAEGDCDEWMYELDRARADPWEWYNATVTKWCEAAAPDALVVAAKGLDEQGAGEAVMDGLRALRHAIQEGAPPPIADMAPVALAGHPAPLAPGPGD